MKRVLVNRSGDMFTVTDNMFVKLDKHNNKNDLSDYELTSNISKACI